MEPYEETIQSWDQVARRYEEVFMDLDLYNDTYDAFCRQVSIQGADILEIGCGPGNITRYLLARRPDFRILGIDAAPAMIERAKANNPGARFLLMDAREISILTAQYEGIVCGFLLPYLSPEDAAQLFRNMGLLLAPGGICYFSVLEGKAADSGYQHSSNGDARMYVHYHEEAQLKDCLFTAGLGLLSAFRKDYADAKGSSSCHLIFIAQKPAVS